VKEIGTTTCGSRYRVTILAGFISALLTTAVTGFVTYSSLSGVVENKARVTRIHSTIDHLADLRFLLNDAENRARDYLITGDQYNLDLYHAAADKVAQEAGTVATLASDQERQQKRFKNLAPMLSARLATLGNAIEVRRQMGFESALEMFRLSGRRSLMDDILRRIDDMIDEERLLLPGHETTAHLKSAIQLVTAGCIAALALIGLTLLLTFRLLKHWRTSFQELSQSAAKLQIRSRLMDTLLDSIDEGVVVLDRDQKVVQTNPLAERLQKDSQPEMADSLKAALEPGLVEPGNHLALALEHFQNPLPAVGIPGTTAPSITAVEHVVHRSIAASARLVRDADGSLQGGLLLFRDVTELRRKEHQLKNCQASLTSLFQDAFEVTFAATVKDVCLTHANEQFIRLFGYSREELLGKTISELNLCDSVGDLEEVLRQAQVGQTPCRRKLVFRTKLGRVFEAVLVALSAEVDGKAYLFFALEKVTWLPFGRTTRSARLIGRILRH
jgi:PAS domain S-box-containing protein